MTMLFRELSKGSTFSTLLDTINSLEFGVKLEAQALSKVSSNEAVGPSGSSHVRHTAANKDHISKS